MFISRASRYAFRISHNVYTGQQLGPQKDRMVSSSAYVLSALGALLSAFSLHQMSGHQQKFQHA